MFFLAYRPAPIWTFGWYGPWVVLVAETAGGHAVGLTLALAMTPNQFGLVAAPPVFGLLVDLADGSYRPAWLAIGIVFVLTFTPVFVGRRRHRPGIEGVPVPEHPVTWASDNLR